MNGVLYVRKGGKILVNEPPVIIPVHIGFNKICSFLKEIFYTVLVVYQHGQSHICGGGATGSDRVRNRKWRDLKFVLHMCNRFQHFSLNIVVQNVVQ